MKKLPTISEAEWEVMRVLWEYRQPLTAQEIIQQLPENKWHPKTVKTLIARLVKKGAISIKDKERVYQYYPLLKERDCIIEESQSLLDRLFGGSLAPMVAHFVQNKKLSKKEIRELVRILHQNDSPDKK